MLSWAAEPYFETHALWADREKLITALTCLVNNAVQFTREGSIALAIAVVGPESARALTVSVTDTGIGIPPECQPAIFDIFERTRYPDRSEGLGLGLPIAKALIELMGGGITVTSTESGTTACLTVPVKIRETECLPSYGKFQVVPIGANVVVLEPNAVLRGLVAALLSTQGFIVHQSPDIEDVLGHLTTGVADALIMSTDCPQFSEWLRILKQSAATQRTPIIGLTENPHDRSAEQVKNQGLFAVLSYKAKPQRLVEVLALCISL